MRCWLRILIATVCMSVGSGVAAQPDADLVALVEGMTAAAAPTNGAPTAIPTATATANILSATGINDALRDSGEVLTTTNLRSVSAASPGALEWAHQTMEWQGKLEMARRQRLQRLYAEARPTLIAVILTNTPDELKRTALLELAIIAQEEGELARAQQIFAHYLSKWPNDPGAPEVMLRQGLIHRQMGLNNLALTKFYAVMTTSLLVKAGQLDYYQRLVLQAQTEIAETYFRQAKFAESAEFFARVLKLDSPLLNKPQIHFKLVRSLAALGKFEEVTAQCYAFLERYRDAAEEPEMRFHLATALKRLGRNGDALQQVLLLLRGQQSLAAARPEIWAQWQLRTGNDIANQLYQEADYLRALEVYSALAHLNTNVDWQIPVQYQIGLTYERLQQPSKALNEYAQIVQSQAVVGTNVAPNLQTILDMARWRQQYLGWQTNTDTALRELKAERAAVPPAGLSVTP